MRVLIADSDPEFLEVAQRYLTHCGHQTQVASNGVESVGHLRRCMPDIVVLERDLLWGGSDGVKEIMGQDVTWAEIPVILMSVNKRSDDTGSDGCPSVVAEFQKPFRLAVLLEKIQECDVQRYECTL